jgi:hypothetical protein
VGLDGPSRTIIVEPAEQPERAPVRETPEAEHEPQPQRKREREPVPA